MSASEIVPILVNTTSASGTTTTITTSVIIGAPIDTADTNCALSVSESSTEDIHLPDIAFEPALDSPGINRESQPLLGGLDVSFNNFQGEPVLLKLFQIFNHTR